MDYVICRNKDIPFGTEVSKDITDKSMHLGEFILNIQSYKIEWPKKNVKKSKHFSIIIKAT